jgi:hypothetical protein
MGKVLHFSTANIAPLRVRSTSMHTVRIRITDDTYAEEARWHAQYAVQNAASCRALDGFTDVLARTGGWHTFKVSSTYYAKQFVRQINLLVLEGRADVEIDGARVHAKIRKVA